MAVTWTTPSGTLFECPSGSFLSLGVTAENATEYSLISGQLPPGIEFDSEGNITGLIEFVDHDTTFNFVVRATDGIIVRDRTFNIKVSYDESISWDTNGFSISGSTLKKLLVNKDHVEIPINANAETQVTYSLDKTTGRLPFGLRLDPSGKIFGSPKINLAPSQAVSYSFDIVASDKYNEYRQNFTFDIIDSFSFTVDNTNFTLGTGTFSLIDLGNTGTVNLSSLQMAEFVRDLNLGTYLADDRQYIPVTAYDPNPGMGPLKYTALDPLPPGLTLDPTLGYLYGNLTAQADYSHLYTFGIEVEKTSVYTNETAICTGTFNLTVVNQWYNNVVWPNSNLGNLIEGIPSELSIKAEQKNDTWPLKYVMFPTTPLPDGLILSQDTGNLIGSATTSGSFTFTVSASTATYANHELDWPVLSYPVSFNTFNLNIIPVSDQYTSIWAKPFLIPAQRQLWEDFISNSNIFLPSILYRPDDPLFGLQEELKIFLEFGIEQVNLGDYANSLYLNLYERRLMLGEVKSAIAKDKDGNHVYDAVFVEIIDDLEGAKSSLNINGVTYYPGSIDNIRNSLQSIVLQDSSEIKVDGKHLPRFMTTVAEGQKYGYFKAAVLCYTLPGQSNKIKNRIRSSKFNFNNLNFFIDRLVVQKARDKEDTSYIVFKKQPIG